MIPKCFEEARNKYKPKDIKFLLIAESPPKYDSGRFFYFLNVKDQDSLFLEVMKVLYPSYFNEYTIPQIRNKKGELLKEFKEDGFYLIDAVDMPMIKKSTSYKKGRIKEFLTELKEKIDKLINKETFIILISRNVYDVCYAELNKCGYNISNREMIDFPGSGKQIKFREKFGELIRTLGYE